MMNYENWLDILSYSGNRRNGKTSHLAQITKESKGILVVRDAEEVRRVVHEYGITAVSVNTDPNTLRGIERPIFVDTDAVTILLHSMGPVPGVLSDGNHEYSIVDVEKIERFRHRPYSRLRATVLALINEKAQVMTVGAQNMVLKFQNEKLEKELEELKVQYHLLLKKKKEKEDENG